jgi:hypothetical protein
MIQNLPSTALLSIFDTTKQQRESFVEGLLQPLRDGFKDPLEVHIQIKCLEDILTRLKDNKEYQELVQEAAAKYGKGKHDVHNATFEVKATAGKYDYSHDAQWSRIKEDLKTREAFLKSLKEPLTTVDPYGEVVEVQPAKYTPGKDSVFISLK